MNKEYNNIDVLERNEEKVITKPKNELKKPSMYKVIMLNDDYTPMEFVIVVLKKFFNKNLIEATHIMMNVHQKGTGLCGVFTKEIAETKIIQTIDYAKKEGYPLQCIMEKD